MSAVAVLPTRMTLDTAWERYAAFVRAIIENPALGADRAHCEAMIRAFKEFSDLFEVVELQCS